MVAPPELPEPPEPREGPEPQSLLELRLLDGPNLYFPRPAAKITLDLGVLIGLPASRAVEVGRALGLGSVRPGKADSLFRQRFAIRVVTQLVRRLAREAGLSRLAVRTRTGLSPSELIVAYPWRNSGRVEALARGMATVIDRLDDGPEAIAALIIETGRAIQQSPLGSRPQLLRPTIPVVAITGTNGKTTTSRLLGHIARQAGRLVGWSSTDGVYIDGELVEAGDFSGPSGAGQVLKHPGVELAVTETARGGILRRGVGVAHNDVSVVTNISADHLGLGGIETLDQLAEVKAVITKITKTSGWCVLNGDDPRTFAMRLGTKASLWIFSMDPDSPSGRIVLDGGGRVTTVLDGWVCVLRSGKDPLAIVRVDAVPMTLAGLSRVNVENVLAAASAAIALGFTPDEVALGLTTFLPGENNPGRMNIWTLPTSPHADLSTAVTVVIDLAHNEAGLAALLEIMAGVRRPGKRLLLGLGTAGDRSDDIFVSLGEMAAVGADVVEIVQKDDYSRGRDLDQLAELIIEGARHAGMEIDVVHPGELACLQSLVARAGPGDVVAMMTHQDRAQVDAWLIDHGATRDSAVTLAAKVERARQG